MDIRKVKKLIEMLEESNISEIEIHEGEESVRISRHSTIEPSQTVVQVPANAELRPSSPELQSSESPVEDRGSAGSITGNIITAPMVGIFYEAATPDRPMC